ncbi:MAG: S-layer homology domain-containing protein [Selenomonas sp.]|nr:S-layer homology domain-containing protein [Selenomonas sp.]MBO6203480.1 S-layer homology domain-containing protein [Selenomonas sp.]
MKKTVLSMLSACLVMGVASSVSAAASPFSDVPTDHWAYDAIDALVADGVIEGYGDGSYQGGRNITRYEMAQMVARAMAKGNSNAADKGLVDKLAAEFAAELNNLGVRVADLERNADVVKWSGEARYTYTSQRTEDQKGKTADSTSEAFLLRLEPKAQVNKNWNVHARLDTTLDVREDSTDNVALKRLWAQGNYKNFNVRLGRIPDTTNYDKNLMFFTQLTGVEVNAGKKIKLQVRAGRINKDNLRYDEALKRATKRKIIEDKASFQSLAITVNPGKLSLTGAYYHFKSAMFKDDFYSNGANEENAHIWEGAATYRFDKNISVTGAFMQNTAADYYNRSGVLHLGYKGANKLQQGSWGAYVSYRHQGGNTSMYPSCDGAFYNTKGVEVSAQYTIVPNVQAKAIYFRGKQLENDRKAEKLFGRVEYWF